MINTCPIRFLLILATLFAPIYSLADVAPDPLSKGMTPTRKESRVQMVSQAVVIDLDRKWCRVEADFVLLNRSRSPAIMEVGFPMDIMGHAFCPRRAGGSPGQPLGQAPEES